MKKNCKYCLIVLFVNKAYFWMIANKEATIKKSVQNRLKATLLLVRKMSALDLPISPYSVWTCPKLKNSKIFAPKNADVRI